MKKVLFLTALLGLMSVSCDKKLEVNPGEVTCKLTVHTVEYDSHIPVKSVTVEILGMGKAKKTNESGVAQFNLPVGEYEMKISSDGYADFIRTVSVEIENESSDLPIAGNQTIDTYMYPLSGTVKGSTTINRDGKVSYQGNVTLKVTPGMGITFITPYTTTSNEDGSFEIANLPAGMSLYIDGEYVENGAFYTNTDYRSFSLKENITTTISAIKLTRSGSAYKTDMIEMPVDKNSPLKLTFALPIDAAKIERNSIKVYNRNDKLIGISYTLSNENRTLLISSSDPDGWSVGSLSDYYFEVSLKSANGDNLSEVGRFGIEGAFTGPITKLNVSYVEKGFLLTWDKLANAQGYEVYVKAKDASDYVLAKTIANDNDKTTTTQSIGLYNYFSGSYSYSLGTYYIKVVGYNSAAKGDVGAATVTTFEYTNVLPALTGVSYNSGNEMLTWNKQANANTYYIYVKAEGSANYYELYYIYDDGSDASTMSVNMSNLLQYHGYGNYSVKIIGKNNYNYGRSLSGDIDAATAVTVEYSDPTL